MSGPLLTSQPDPFEVLKESHRDFLEQRGYILSSAIGTGSQGSLVRALRVHDNEVLAMADSGVGINAVAGSGSSPMRDSKKAALDQECAIKIIPKATLTELTESCVLREVRVLGAVKHPSICVLLDAFVDDDNYYLVMELIRYGDLFSRISEHPIDEIETCLIAEQLLSALTYLHSKGYAHRDIKLENVMISHFVSYSKDDLEEYRPETTYFDRDMRDYYPHVKLIDFGVCNERDPGDSPTSTLYCGTSVYLSPQIVSQEEYVPEEADMYSLGVMLFTMLSGRYPFAMQNRDELFNAILHEEPSFTGPEWEGVSEEVIEIVRSMMNKDGESRPTASDSLIYVRELLARWLKEEMRRRRAAQRTKKLKSTLFKPFKIKNRLKTGTTMDGANNSLKLGSVRKVSSNPSSRQSKRGFGKGKSPHSSMSLKSKTSLNPKTKNKQDKVDKAAKERRKEASESGTLEKSASRSLSSKFSSGSFRTWGRRKTISRSIKVSELNQVIEIHDSNQASDRNEQPVGTLWSPGGSKGTSNTVSPSRMSRSKSSSSLKHKLLKGLKQNVKQQLHMQQNHGHHNPDTTGRVVSGPLIDNGNYIRKHKAPKENIKPVSA